MSSSETPSAPRTWPLVARAAELALAKEVVCDGLVRALVLAGPPGVGKTRLAQEILRQAEDEACAICWVLGSSATRSIPMGAFTRFLPDLTGVTQFELLGRVASQLISRAEGRRLLIGVDDAHELDDTSVALLHQLVVSGAAFVVLTVRRGASVPEPITSLWKDGLAERMEVRPLARAESNELVAVALGGQVDGTTLHELFELSCGNPLFLRELVLGGLASGALADSGGVWRWSGPMTVALRLVELIESRMAQLTAPQRAALEVVAFGEPLPAHIVCTVGEDVAGHLQSLERAGLIAADSAEGTLLVRLAHPLYGEVLRAQTPALRVKEVHRQLALAVAPEIESGTLDIVRINSWRLAAGELGDAQQLVDAADHALQTLDHQRAEQFARAAVRAGAGPRAQRLLATALARNGSPIKAEVSFARIPANQLDDAERVKIATARAINLQWRLGRASDAETVLDEAIRTTTSRSARCELSAVKAGFLCYDLNCREALRAIRPITDDPEAAPSARIRAFAVASEALAATGKLNAATAAARDGRNLAAQLPSADILVHLALATTQLSSLTWAGRLAEAHKVALSGYEEAITRQSSFQTAAFAGWLAAVARAQGRIETARDLIREAVERGRAPDVCTFRRFLPRLLAELALTTAMCGDAATAEGALEEARRLDTPPSRIVGFWTAMAQPWIAAAQGATSRAVALCLRFGERAANLGLHTFELIALHDALRFDPTADVAPRLTQLLTEVEGPLAAVCASHARALASGDGAGLDQVAQHFASLGAQLLAAEAATHAALTYRRRGSTTLALASASQARAWARNCEGARTPALRVLEAPPTLTPREREISELAAHGHSSKEIAHRLVISVRTVDNTLHEVYTKLGINRRRELGPILGGPPAGAGGTRDRAIPLRPRPVTE